MQTIQDVLLTDLEPIDCRDFNYQTRQLTMVLVLLLNFAALFNYSFVIANLFFQPLDCWKIGGVPLWETHPSRVTLFSHDPAYIPALILLREAVYIVKERCFSGHMSYTRANKAFRMKNQRISDRVDS